MGTEILRPQDCLMRVPSSSTASISIPRSRKPSSNSYYYSSNPNTKFYRKTEQRKQHPQPQPQQQQQYHRYFSQSETSVVKNGVRSSPKLTPSSSPPAATGKSVVKSDVTTTSVTILKRGESLDNINSKKKAEKLKIKRSISGDLSSGFSSSSSSSSSSGSESSSSDSERGVVRSEVYAGNAFYLSPAPSSLPLPTFFSIKKEGGCGASTIIDDSATKDLRRLLRLD